MRKTIRIGVLGAASIAKRSIIPSLQKLPEIFEIVGLASRTDQPELQRELGIPVVKGYDELLKFQELEAVYIPLPTGMHSEWIHKALDRGLHVWSEKSLGQNSDEVQAITQKAEKLNLAVLESFQFRFHAQLRALKKIIESGKLGEMRLFRSTFGFPPFQDKTNIRYQSHLGGGALLDAGAYTLKAAQLFLGDGLKVEAAHMHWSEELGVDLWGSAQLSRLSDGLSIQLAYGFDNYYQCGIEVWGSLGKLFTNRLFTAREDYIPQASLETASGTEIIALPKDDHFVNIALHFAHLLEDEAQNDKEVEYRSNLLQSSLIQEIRTKSHV